MLQGLSPRSSAPKAPRLLAAVVFYGYTGVILGKYWDNGKMEATI